jgi:hypothetical protein
MVLKKPFVTRRAVRLAGTLKDEAVGKRARVSRMRHFIGIKGDEQ